jgi:D-alanyl-D-alanine carboxypeptidase/D-alanyl-D-alanine-endopeptidase (penicillin-binding protein 4)
VRKALLASAIALCLGGGGTAAYVISDEPEHAAAPVVEPSPYPERTPLVVPAGDGTAPTTQGLRAALSAALRDARLGTSVSLSVVDVASDRVLLDVQGDRAVTPASTAKIATAAAVLATLPRDQRFVTKVVRGRPGEVVLVGGGDPTLVGSVGGASAVGPRLSDLAAQVRTWARTSGTTVRRVLVDDSLFTGPRLGPGWKQGYVTDGDVAPVSALSVDAGRTSDDDGTPRSQDPALQAGRQLARLLKAKSAGRTEAARDAVAIARVSSAPVADLVERMLTSSDNDLAEALGRHVALATRRPASFAGEAQAIAAALQRHGLQVALKDASGLSTQDRAQPAQIASLLAHAARDGTYAPLLTGLPVAGFDGTLSDRYRKGPTRSAAGEVRAKTGTLNGVSALAGYVRTRSGRLLAFDLTTNGVRIGATRAAQAALDRVATAIAACGCG